MSSYLDRLRSASESCLNKHDGALSWRSELALPVVLVWLPRQSSAELDGLDDTELVLSRNAARRIRKARLNPHLSRRASYAVADRVALKIAMEELLPLISARQKAKTDRTPITEPTTPSPQSCYLYHTRLGGPKVGWSTGLAQWAAERGIKRRDLHISFTHDGDAHICALAWAPGLKGLGVDTVHLPRLNDVNKDERYLSRFAEKFMSRSELDHYHESGKGEPRTQFAIRAAAHFSLMESASKALGTGLKIGGGMGKPTSMRKQSLNVACLDPVEFSITLEAKDRIRSLKASRLEGYWAADKEYLVSLAALR